MRLNSRKGPQTTARERLILDRYYEWVVGERNRLWGHRTPERELVCRQVSTMQNGREVDVPDEWIAEHVPPDPDPALPSLVPETEDLPEPPASSLPSL